MNPRGVESRISPRLAVRLSAEVRHGASTFTAVTRDLSIGGVCLEADRALPEGDPLVVVLFLVVDDVEDAAQPALEMKGKVAWAVAGEGAEPARMGVRFESVSPHQLDGLSRFLKLVAAAA